LAKQNHPSVSVQELVMVLTPFYLTIFVYMNYCLSYFHQNLTLSHSFEQSSHYLYLTVFSSCFAFLRLHQTSLPFTYRRTSATNIKRNRTSNRRIHQK